MLQPLFAALLLAPTSWTQKLPDGTSVSLVAVTNFGKRMSWKPDGSKLPQMVAPDVIKQMNGAPKGSASSSVVNFVVQLKPSDPTQAPSVTFQVNGSSLGFGYTLLDLHNSKLWWAGAGHEAKGLGPTVNLKLGVAAGRWKTTSSHNLENGITKGPKFFMSIMHPQMHKSGSPGAVVLDVTVPAKVKGLAYRFKVYCSDGSTLSPAGSMQVGGHSPRYYFVENGKRFSHVDLQTRPYKWITFKGVHTKSR